MTRHVNITATTLLLLVAVTANASEVSFDFASTNGTQSAAANFTFTDVDAGLGSTYLTISLTNTMTSNGGPQWLTGLFFDIAGSPTLAYENDSAVGDMITLDGTTQTPYNLHGAKADNFWAYRDDLSGELPFGDQQYGLGAAGIDIFSLSDMLSPPPDAILPQPAGTDGGILADIVGLEVPGGHEGRPFVLGSLQFTFWLEDFALEDANVSDIAFFFGTGFDEVILLIPLPMPLAMAGVGLGIVVLFRRRLATLACA